MRPDSLMPDRLDGYLAVDPSALGTRRANLLHLVPRLDLMG